MSVNASGAHPVRKNGLGRRTTTVPGESIFGRAVRGSSIVCVWRERVDIGCGQRSDAWRGNRVSTDRGEEGDSQKNECRHGG